MISQEDHQRKIISEIRERSSTKITSEEDNHKKIMAENYQRKKKIIREGPSKEDHHDMYHIYISRLFLTLLSYEIPVRMNFLLIP